MRRGERFIEKRVVIKPKILKKLIYEAKQHQNFTWKQFSQKLKVSEQSIRHGWAVKGNTIPLSILKNLLTFHPYLNLKKIKHEMRIFEPYWGQRIGKKSKNEGKTKLPKINNKRFAEFYGILLGDGCVFSNLSGFSISSNKLVDKIYINQYVCPLIKELFGIDPKLYYPKGEDTIQCILYSKDIARHLVKLGFPKGKKKEGNLQIPDIFFSNRILLRACLRGLIDSDGSVCPHPNSKIMISISITSEPLLASTDQAFKKLNIPIGAYSKGINIYGEKKATKVFNTIGSSNWKNLTKYDIFLNTGRVPYTKEIETLL